MDGKLDNEWNGTSWKEFRSGNLKEFKCSNMKFPVVDDNKVLTIKK